MKQQVLKTCRLMLESAVRLCLRAGVGFREFEEISKQVFVDVARRDYGLSGRPTNSARVALMTGLSRREVGRLRKALLEGDESETPESRSRLSQILSGWHLDPEFTDEQGTPLVLPLAGAKSISLLLDRYGGDIPRGALLKEMLNLNLIEGDDGGYRVVARDYIRAAADPDMLRQGGQALHDHAGTVIHNVFRESKDQPRFERMATERQLSAADVQHFERLLAEEGQSFLERIDRWLSARKSDANAPGDVRMGVGIYQIIDHQ